MTEKARSDAQVREDDARRIREEGDAIERRAVGSPGTITRRAVVADDVERAANRGVFRDGNGARRVVGAGDPIPDGWEHIEDASIEDRVGTVPNRQSAGDDVADGGGEAPKSKRSRSSS